MSYGHGEGTLPVKSLVRSLAELGSEADAIKRDLQMLNSKRNIAQSTLNQLDAEIAAKQEVLQSLQERATQAFDAIRGIGQHGEETPPEPVLAAIDGHPSVFNGAQF